MEILVFRVHKVSWVHRVILHRDRRDIVDSKAISVLKASKV